MISALQNDLPGHIYQLSLELQRLLRHRMLARKDQHESVNPLHLFSLMIISEHPGIQMNEFAKHLKITSPSATSLANRLMKQKLITRTTDRKNRRLVRLKLTRSGADMLKHTMAAHGDAMRSIFSMLREEDQREFHRILSNLVSTLSDVSL